MKQGRKQFYDNVIDLPEGRSGKVTIRHILKPAGTTLRSGTLRTALYGQKDKEITYADPTVWHELSEDDHGVWMTDLPIEQKQMDALIDKAHGRVLVGGLGVGYAVVALAQKPRVKSITVVERDADVIALVWEATLATVAKQAKVPGRVTCEIVHADLFDYLKARPAFYQWGLFDIWQSDGETTFHETVVPLRKLADGMVRTVECWNEDIMRGQLMQGLHSRMFLLTLPQVSAEGWPNGNGLNLDMLCEDTDNIYRAWAVPFWRRYRDSGHLLDHDTLNYAMQRYVICYGQPALDVLPILQHLTALYGKESGGDGMKWDDVKPVTWTNAAGFAFSDKGAYYRRTDVEQARAADAEQHTKLQLMWQNQIRTIDDLQEQNDLLRHQINELNSLVQWHEEHQTHLKALLPKETA